MAERPSTLGETIRDARVKKGLSLRHLAGQLGIASSYLSDIEFNRRVPSEPVLRSICGVLELDVDKMLSLAGRLGEQADRYLRRNPSAAALFRRVSGADLGEAEIRVLHERLDQLVQERGPEEEQP